MAEATKGAPKATEEQLLYAGILSKGMIFGLLTLILTFFIYLSGILEPKVPLADIQEYWKMPVKDYLEKSGIHTGWSWVGDLKYGDMLNFAPIAFLSGLTIFCYLAILPSLIKKKDTIYVVLVILEVLVLSLAASGILSGGAH